MAPLSSTQFGGHADPRRVSLVPPCPGADKPVGVTGRVEAATAAQVESQTRGKVLRVAACTNRAELPEAATVLQEAKVRLVRWPHWFGFVFERSRLGP